VAKIDDPGADRRGPRKYLLIFDFLFGSDHWGRSLKVDVGITESFFGCGLSPSDLAQRQTDFLVAPPP